VKFQFSEIVNHPDVDLVLRTLKHCLRDISLTIEQTEDQLTIYGLGPSFRTMNPNDRSSFRAVSQGTVTIIRGEVNFLASALMGDMPQDAAVLSKIEQAVRCLRVQLSVDVVRPDDSASLRPSEPVPSLNSEAPTYLGSEMPSPVFSEPLISAEAAFQPPTSNVAAEPVRIEAEEPRVIEPSAAKHLEPLPVVTAAAPPFRWPEPDLGSKAVSASPLPSFSTRNVEVPKHGRTAMLPLALLSGLFILCAAYFLQHRYLIANPFKGDQPATTQTGSVPAKGTDNQRLTSPEPAQPVSTSPEDIKVWVEKWAAAMSTGDPQEQISFYADPVDRYFLNGNVSRNQLLRDKQAEIADRSGLLAFKAEDVVIDHRTESKIVMRLLKHIIIKSPSASIREQRIKTQLKLTLIDGKWKITSERTLG
jgi:hypothetical protein